MTDSEAAKEHAKNKWEQYVDLMFKPTFIHISEIDYLAGCKRVRDQWKESYEKQSEQITALVETVKRQREFIAGCLCEMRTVPNSIGLLTGHYNLCSKCAALNYPVPECLKELLK